MENNGKITQDWDGSCPGLWWEGVSEYQGRAAFFKHFFKRLREKREQGLIPGISTWITKWEPWRVWTERERMWLPWVVGRVYSNFKHYKNSWFLSTVSTSLCMSHCNPRSLPEYYSGCWILEFFLEMDAKMLIFIKSITVNKCYQIFLQISKYFLR